MATVERTAPRRVTSRAARQATEADRKTLVARCCSLQPELQRHLSTLVHAEMCAVTDHQLTVLTCLRHQSMTMSELAKKLEVGESAATAVVDRLVRQELVVRHDDPADRRVVRLTLSHAGQSMVTKLQATSLRKTARVLTVLSDEQLAQLVAIMETLDAACKPTEDQMHKAAVIDNTIKEPQ